jgi:hypothetical protein
MRPEMSCCIANGVGMIEATKAYRLGALPIMSRPGSRSAFPVSCPRQAFI